MRHQLTASHAPRTVSARGLSIHGGEPSSVTLTHAAPGHGIVFLRAGHRTRATLDAVHDTSMQTRLGAGAGSVATVEHLLSACAGLGMWDLRVDVDGSELPILDGSALPWVTLLEQLTATPRSTPRRAPSLTVRAPIEVRDGARYARLEPDPACRVTATLTDPAHASLGPSTVQITLDPHTYRELIAPARTFVLARDAQRLLAAGFGRGADLDNTLVVTPSGVDNPTGLRLPSEPVRHKILDALGDLALLGQPFAGHLILHDSSHALHVALARAVQAHCELAA